MTNIRQVLYQMDSLRENKILLVMMREWKPKDREVKTAKVNPRGFNETRLLAVHRRL